MQNNRKHVRADTRNGVVDTALGLDTVGHHLEHVVAHIDRIRGVDRAETVNIQQGHRKQVIGALESHIDIDLELFQEELAVIHAGKSILIGVIVVLLGLCLLVGIFVERTHDADGVSGIVHLHMARKHKAAVGRDQ